MDEDGDESFTAAEQKLELETTKKTLQEARARGSLRKSIDQVIILKRTVWRQDQLYVAQQEQRHTR